MMISRTLQSRRIGGVFSQPYSTFQSNVSNVSKRKNDSSLNSAPVKKIRKRSKKPIKKSSTVENIPLKKVSKKRLAKKKLLKNGLKNVLKKNVLKKNVLKKKWEKSAGGNRLKKLLKSSPKNGGGKKAKKLLLKSLKLFLAES